MRHRERGHRLQYMHIYTVFTTNIFMGTDGTSQMVGKLNIVNNNITNVQNPDDSLVIIHL